MQCDDKLNMLNLLYDILHKRLLSFSNEGKRIIPFHNKFSLILILYAPSYNIYVRLNLINHFVGFILCQFAYNSAFRNPVFWWESCKGSVWESMKKSSKVCNSVGPCDWNTWLASHQSWHTCEACRGAEESRQLLHYKTKVSGWPGS